MNQLNTVMASFSNAHRQLTENLEHSLYSLGENIDDKAETREVCTDEWYLAIENTLDDIAKMLYSMSELGLITVDDSQKISNLRLKVSDLHDKYMAVLVENGDFLPVSCGMNY